MTVTIELKPETEKRLAERAEQKGLTIETFIEVFIEDKLEESENSQKAEPFYKTATKDEWRAEFEKWMDSHTGKNYPSIPDEALRRENMYEDRF